MEVIEVRNLEQARRFVVEGLGLQRAVKPVAATVRSALEWAMEVASSGQPLPPIGFVADIGHIAFGTDTEHRQKEPLHLPGWPANLGRMYEDHVLGKFFADWTLERAGDALRCYQGKDRIKGLAYIVNQIRDRGDIGGVLLPPAVIRSLLTANPDEVLAAGWEKLETEGPLDLLIKQYENLVNAGRRMVDVLSPEDVIALEQRTALADMGQYVAHRQILQAAARIESQLPMRPVHPLRGRKEVPTRILDEDQYPVGGYTSIATRGSLESLLHSQLAYIDPLPASGPDLFDYKFVRDELFYYSRDENQFLRRRRAFVFVLFPDLVAARFKDAELPFQRIVMIQATVLALIRKLSDWLSHDAIRFDVLFVQDGEKKVLTEEAALLERVLREPIARGDARVAFVPSKAAIIEHVNLQSRQAQVHNLAIATEPFKMDLDRVVVTELAVNGPRPLVGSGDGILSELEGEDAFDVWQETILQILKLWV